MFIAIKTDDGRIKRKIRMYQALQLKQPDGVHIPSERTVYRVMEEKQSINMAFCKA